MDAASSGRAEVDTSRAFRSVKEAVAVFGERLAARETQLRPGAHADCRAVRERISWPNGAAAIVATTKLERGAGGRPSGVPVRESLAAKLEKGDGGRSSGLVRESLCKLNAIANARPWRGGRKLASSLMPVRDVSPMSLVLSSSPVVPPSPRLGNISDERRDRKEAHLTAMNSIKKVEEEAAKTRQEVFQVRKRMAETELAMANLNAKLHHALSKMAHMEADSAAAARASLQQQRSGDMAAALTVWTEQQPLRQPLGHILSIGRDTDDEEENHGQRKVEATTTTATKKRKVEKEKPIVPLVVPLIYGMLFSRKKKKKTKDREKLYMKELYGLLRLT